MTGHMNETLTITDMSRINNSMNGNPRYAIAFDNGLAVYTMSDAGFCYAIGNKDMREGSRVTVELTRAGRIRHMAPAK